MSPCYSSFPDAFAETDELLELRPDNLDRACMQGNVEGSLDTNGSGTLMPSTSSQDSTTLLLNYFLT